jgi:hypothetical protein
MNRERTAIALLAAREGRHWTGFGSLRWVVSFRFLYLPWVFGQSGVSNQRRHTHPCGTDVTHCKSVQSSRLESVCGNASKAKVGGLIELLPGLSVATAAVSIPFCLGSLGICSGKPQSARRS